MIILYIDCTAGIAGDMTVAACLDLGVPLEVVRSGLALLPLPPDSFRLGVESVRRRGVAARHFTVEAADDTSHRHYADIAALIDASRLPASVRNRAGRIFLKLAEAEAKVHGVPLEKVHFHEVGALDSIVDIVATAICLDVLGVDEVHAAPLPWGSGFVETSHGRLPVPAPATAELMRGLPVHGDCGPGERVTPTGAAIVAALATGFGAPPTMRVTAVGSGAGTKDFPDMPNVLRLVLGERRNAPERDEAVVLETHIDDMNPEILGYLMERLLTAGALDAAFSPLQMKKNRPGTRLTVIAPPAQAEELAAVILAESTAIGVRSYRVDRFILPRTVEERQTSLGPVRVKVLKKGGAVVRVVPEFEECRRLAVERGLPLLDVYRLVEREVTPA